MYDIKERRMMQVATAIGYMLAAAPDTDWEVVCSINERTGWVCEGYSDHTGLMREEGVRLSEPDLWRTWRMAQLGPD